MKLGILLIALATLLTVSNARSEGAKIYFPANIMLNYCHDNFDKKTTQQLMDLTFCRGYVAAVGASYECDQTYHPDYESDIPAGVTVDQLLLIFAKYMRDHPEKLNIDGTYVAAEAFAKAFPCK